MLHSLSVWDEDVDLGPRSWTDTGGGGDVRPGVADCGSHLRQGARGVLDLDGQVNRHESVPPAYFG
jgi:hypothetical protein